MSDVFQSLLISLILVVVVVVIAMLIISGGVNPANDVREIEEAKASYKRVSGLIKLAGESSASCTYTKDGDVFVYTIKITANIVSGESYTEGIFPAIEFKEKDVTNVRNFPIEGGVSRTISDTFEVRTKKSPLQRIETDSFQGRLEPGQSILINNFVVELLDYLQVRPDIINLPNVVTGPCTPYFSIECVEDSSRATVYLSDESKSCYVQSDEDRTKCSSNKELCEGEITITLEEFQSGADCPGKEPVFFIDAPRPAKEWENVGEKITLAFWKMPEEAPQEDCWERTLGGLKPLDIECYDDFVGAYEVMVPECVEA